MADARIIRKPEDAFELLCDTLDARNWHYDKDEEKMFVQFTVGGDDLPMQIFAYVDASKSLISFMSNFPFDICDDKKIDAAIAVTTVNYTLAQGCFDYDVTKGRIIFRVVVPFEDCRIGTDLINHSIDLVCFFVDKYNDKFFALNKGFITIEQFIENEK